MGTICSINHRNNKIKIRRNIPEKSLFKEYIYSCFIFKTSNDKILVFGFFCKLRYPSQNIPVPIFITSKDSFPENFNFDDKYNISINNNDILFRFNFKTIYLSDTHNIVILQIYEDYLKLLNISFLEIDNYDYLEDINKYLIYSFNKLENGNFEFSKFRINKVNKEDYTFDYPNQESNNAFKYALLLNNNNKLVGIYMKKSNNKGILIIGIINEIIQKNQINNTVNNIFNNNEHYMEDEIDNYRYEENKKIGNLNSLRIVSNDIGRLNYKNSSKINQINDDKNSSINNLYNEENNSKSINIKGNDINKQSFEENKNNYLKRAKNEIVDNKNFKENNELEKLPESKNVLNLSLTQNEYEKNDICNKKVFNNDNNGKISKEISLFFVFNNGKELYLDIEESCIFEQVIEKLNEKYLWLKNIEIKDYKINSTSILKNKTVKENKLVDNSTINIIE